MREQAGYAKTRWNFARFSVHYNLDACGHFEDGAGVLSLCRALSRKRSSPWRAPVVARITSAVPSVIVAGNGNVSVARPLASVLAWEEVARPASPSRKAAISAPPIASAEPFCLNSTSSVALPDASQDFALSR